MSRPSITIRYRRPALVLASIMVAALALDTVLWSRTTTQLQMQIETALRNARAEGWRVTASPSRKAGWPFGASVEIGALAASRDDDRKSAVQTQAAQTGVDIRLTDLHLGGSWFALIEGGSPVSTSSAELVRGGAGDSIATLRATDLNARVFADGHLTISASGTRYVSAAPDRDIAAWKITGRLIVSPAARRGETRFGADLKAAAVNGLPLPSVTTAEDAHLAVALESAGRDAEQRTGDPLFDATDYQKLYLQDASGTVADSRIILSGTISLPEENGTIVVTLPEWHAPALHLIDRLIGDPRLAPDLQETLHDAAQKLLVSPRNTHHPVSIALPVTDGRVENPVDALSGTLDSGH